MFINFLKIFVNPLKKKRFPNLELPLIKRLLATRTERQKKNSSFETSEVGCGGLPIQGMGYMASPPDSWIQHTDMSIYVYIDIYICIICIM